MANRFRDDDIDDSFVADLVGLPARKKSAPKKRIAQADPTSFAASKDVGFFSTEKEKEASIGGMKDAGDALAKEHSGLRPKPKKITGLSSVSQDAPQEKEPGGFVSFEQGAKKRLPKAVANFGLPTDRMPSIEELGGALGGIAKYVSQLSRLNRAKGLSPGTGITKTVDKGEAGLTKAAMSSLTKRLEIASLSGDKDKAARLEEQLDAMIQGRGAGDIEDEDDIEAITGL